MDGVIVRLTERERQRARECADIRLRDAKKAGATDRMGIDSVESHFWGALGEIAVAKHIDVHWACTTRTWAARDVGRYEVRSVRPGTAPYIKSKPNDPPGRAIALVVFSSETECEVVGWTTAAKVVALGTLDDPGGYGAPAHFVRDLSLLDPIFPEIRMPWDDGAPEPVPATPSPFPLTRSESGRVEVVSATCPDCGAQYLIQNEHLRSPEHRAAIARKSTLPGQMEIADTPPQPDYGRFTERPARVDFGIHALCPRCGGKKRRAYTDGHGHFHEAETMCMDPRNHKVVCTRCNGFGVVPNSGPIATATPE